MLPSQAMREKKLKLIAERDKLKKAIQSFRAPVGLPLDSIASQISTIQNVKNIIDEIYSESEQANEYGYE